MRALNRILDRVYGNETVRVDEPHSFDELAAPHA